jgi:hypothetical protein
MSKFECGDLHGGKMPFTNVDEDGMCDHPACAEAKIEQLQSKLDQIADLVKDCHDMGCSEEGMCDPCIIKSIIEGDKW